VSRAGHRLGAASLALLLVGLQPAPLLAAPPGATLVQSEGDLFVDDDRIGEDADDMPQGDFDMPQGDLDVQNEPPAPKPRPEPVARPVPVAEREPAAEPPAAKKPVLIEDPSEPDDFVPPPPKARRPLGEEGPGRGVLLVPDEPSEAEGDGILWVVGGVGATVGIAAIAGASVAGVLLLGGFGSPRGSVTITPR
jgi:hypothetical protein